MMADRAPTLRRVGGKTTRRDLEMAIGGAIGAELKAYEVEDACVRLGLPPSSEFDDDPMGGKAWYVRRRLTPLPLWRVVEIGREVVDAYGRDGVEEVLVVGGGVGPRHLLGGRVRAVVAPRDLGLVKRFLQGLRERLGLFYVGQVAGGVNYAQTPTQVTAGCLRGGQWRHPVAAAP